MTPGVGFLTFLLVTVAFLGGIVVTGKRARTHLARHLASIAGALGALAVTIAFAIRLGELYDLPAAGLITPVHLTLAKVCVVAYLLPLVTGVLAWRAPARAALHRRMAYLVLGMTLVTVFTGAWMLLASPEVQAAEVSGPGGEPDRGASPAEVLPNASRGMSTGTSSGAPPASPADAPGSSPAGVVQAAEREGT